MSKHAPAWLTRLLDARARHYQLNYPAAVRDHGVPAAKAGAYKDTTANGMTRCIVDFLIFNGHDAQRISVQGQIRKIGGHMQWTRGGMRRGAADVHAIVNGRHVSIEVKAGRDRMSEHQQAERERITRAGGVYLVVRSMDDFICWYDSL